MRQLKTLSIFLLVALLATSFVACSKDDDNSDFDLSTYVLGTWHTYKATVIVQGGAYSGESRDVEITKIGQYSDSYFESHFQEGGLAKFGKFQKDESGIEHWEEEEVTYSINGDIVTMRDSDGESVALTFDKKERALCLQVSGTKDGIPYRMILYLKK